MADQNTPEQRAAEAAEALADAGLAVTARAVRERTAANGPGVRMGVAATAAREWKEREDAARTIPEVPAELERPFTAIWRTAHTLATATYDDERAGLQAKFQQAQDDRDAIAHDLESVEADLDETRRALDRARAEARAAAERARDNAAQAASAAAEALASERSRADRAEASLAAAEAERDRTIAERDRLLAALAAAAAGDSPSPTS
ncbi:DNA-binding protein [Isoptericola rhizosphaerae]|uniref:DNA-binding protein n=1 Tax=Isoptericola rhizosphaerae TaxID=3377837 RepID=UPI00383AC5F0